MFSDPVFGQDFFDRKEILDLVHKRIRSFARGYRQNVALLGRPLMGKTSILYQLLHHWTHREATPLYFEIRSESLASFAERFMTSFLYRTPKEKMSQSKVWMDTYQEARFLLNKGSLQEGFMRLLDLVDLYVRENQQPCVLLLDEFHLLETILGAEAFAVLGKKILVQRQVMYLLTSSAVPHAKEILRTRLNLLFGQFEIVSVGPFSTQAADEFLQNRLGDFLPKVDRSFLITISGASPFYLDVLSRQLKFSKDSTSKESLIAAFHSTLFVSQGILFQYFAHLVSRLRSKPAADLLLKVLLNLANGHHRVRDLIASCGLSRNCVGQALKGVCEENLAVRNGAFYFCPDQIFRLWLRSVYPIKIGSSGADFQIQAEQFQKELSEWMSQFIKENEKSLEERIADLIGSFDNDLFELEGRRGIRLPRFQKTEFQSNGSIGHVTAYLPNSRQWNWVIHPEPLEEFTVSELKPSRERQQIQKQIILALKGVDPNAALLAKETKIWTWDIEDLNRVMEAYGKQKIIL